MALEPGQRHSAWAVSRLITSALISTLSVGIPICAITVDKGLPYRQIGARIPGILPRGGFPDNRTLGRLLRRVLTWRILRPP